MDYNTIGGASQAQSSYSLKVSLITFAGAFIATLGVAQWLVVDHSGFLHASVEVARPVLTHNAGVRLPRSPVLATSARQASQGPFAEISDEDIAVQGAASAQKQGLAAMVGLTLGAFGAFFAHKLLNKKHTHSWSMAAVEADDELPTPDELLAARQEYLRLRGKGPGAQLAPGEILRKVNFPGQDGPVDLVELYQRFDELLGESVEIPTAGTKVTGTVFDLDERGAGIDFGGKTIGFCPLEELALCKVKKASDVLSIGERRVFEILASPTTRRKDDEEFILLSLKTLQEEIAWKRLQQYRENDVTFRVILKGKNRGGYMIEVDDLAVPGFLPKSQATSDLATAPETVDPATFMDQVVEVKVLDLDPERKRLVVSQRAANPKMAADVFKVGTVHEGVVQNVKPYGVFVDVNGMSGLLHISQISHNRIDNVDSIFKVGDKIKCMVLSQDQVQGRLALSTKRLEPTHGDMLVNPQMVYEKAEEMAERFRQDIAAAEKRMQEFEAKLAEQNSVAF